MAFAQLLAALVDLPAKVKLGHDVRDGGVFGKALDQSNHGFLGCHDEDSLTAGTRRVNGGDFWCQDFWLSGLGILVITSLLAILWERGYTACYFSTDFTLRPSFDDEQVCMEQNKRNRSWQWFSGAAVFAILAVIAYRENAAMEKVVLGCSYALNERPYSYENAGEIWVGFLAAISLFLAGLGIFSWRREGRSE